VIEATGRGDGRKAAEASQDLWAWVSLVSALLGVGAVATIAASAADAGFLSSLPDWAGSVLYGAVPFFGLLAVFSGIAGRGRGLHGWVTRAGIALGCLLVVAALAAVVLLLNAFRTAS